jgi:hypothetical protein
VVADLEKEKEELHCDWTRAAESDQLSRGGSDWLRGLRIDMTLDFTHRRVRSLFSEASWAIGRTGSASGRR